MPRCTNDACQAQREEPYSTSHIYHSISLTNQTIQDLGWLMEQSAQGIVKCIRQPPRAYMLLATEQPNEIMPLVGLHNFSPSYIMFG
jgi:hypothetical protein